MDDAGVVRRGDGGTGPEQEADQVGGCRVCLVHVVRQCLTLDEAHCEVPASVGQFADPVHRNDAGVVELGRKPGLLQEQRDSAGSVQQLWSDDLLGEDSVHLGVADTTYFAHSADSDTAQIFESGHSGTLRPSLVVGKPGLRHPPVGPGRHLSGCGVREPVFGAELLDLVARRHPTPAFRTDARSIQR